MDFPWIQTFSAWSLSHQLLAWPLLSEFDPKKRQESLCFDQNLHRVGDKAVPVLSFFSSLATLTSALMDFVLTYMSPMGLLSLVATQVSFVGQNLTKKMILPFLSDPGKPGVRSMGPLVCPSQTTRRL